MLGKAFGLGKKHKKNTPDTETAAINKSTTPVGNIPKLLNPTGRIGLQTLQKMANVYDKLEFMRFVRQPVFVGSSIQAGSFSDQTRTNTNEMNKTIIFEAEVTEDASSASETLKHAIYPLIKREHANRAQAIFSVGRVGGNDMVMPDLAISKQHAFLEIKRGDCYIRDGGSTNGTLLNGRHVGKKPMQLRDGDIVGFARYEFSLLFPESLYNMLKGL